MRALTSSGVSHHEKDGQSFWKNRFFCGLLHFSGMVNFMVSVCVCVDSSLVFSPSASWVTCAGDFLHCCSSIKELAVAQFSLFPLCILSPLSTTRVRLVHCNLRHERIDCGQSSSFQCALKLEWLYDKSLQLNVSNPNQYIPSWPPHSSYQWMPCIPLCSLASQAPAEGEAEGAWAHLPLMQKVPFCRGKLIFYFFFLIIFCQGVPMTMIKLS